MATMKTDGINAIWVPQAKQIAFMRRPEYEVLYGGAAGGGKSDCLLAEALRQVDIPHYRAIIFRKTYPQLTELIDRSQQIYSLAFPKAVYNESKHMWKFPSGARIYFGSMQHTKDRINYQGKHYDFVGFDELTHFTWEEYSYMFSRNRPSKNPKSDQKTRVYIRATTNPGGVGHGWVKDRFITCAPPLTTVWEEVEIREPDGKTRKIKRDRVFVPATVFDNQILLEQDPNYLGNLALMPGAERDALLYGNWDSFEGQVFREWKNDPEHYRDGKWTHVIDPFMPPKHWLCVRAFDFGYSRPFSVGWYVFDEEGKAYRIREYYGCNGTANVGLKLDPTAIAKNIKEIEETDPLLKGRRISGVADPAIFDESRGQSIAALMEMAPYYIDFDPGDHHRLPGLMQVHYRLSFDENGECMLQVFNTCKHFIRTIPSLVYDDANVEDVDTDTEDHIFDELKYCLMEHRIAPRANAADKPYDPMGNYDPLNQNTTTKLRRYGAI